MVNHVSAAALHYAKQSCTQLNSIYGNYHWIWGNSPNLLSFFHILTKIFTMHILTGIVMNKDLKKKKKKWTLQFMVRSGQVLCTNCWCLCLSPYYNSAVGCCSAECRKTGWRVTQCQMCRWHHLFPVSQHSALRLSSEAFQCAGTATSCPTLDVFLCMNTTVNGVAVFTFTTTT